MTQNFFADDTTIDVNIRFFQIYRYCIHYLEESPVIVSTLVPSYVDEYLHVLLVPADGPCGEMGWDSEQFCAQ